jgi:hypothetical protein
MLLVLPSSIPFPDLEETVTLLISSLPLLTSLRFLSINAIENARIFGLLLQAISTSSMVRTLQHLKLRGHVGIFAELEKKPPCESSFESLVELSLHLIDHQDVDGITQDTQNESLLLKPFFLSLGPTLQLLKIESLSMLNLSPLFISLSQPVNPALFPNLKSFFLSIEAVEPYALHHFLLPHYFNLQHIQLRILNPEAMDAWLNEFITSESQLPSLQTLKIFLSTNAGTSPILSLIKRTSPTLSSLVLVGQRFWSHEEATQIICALARATPRTAPGDLRSLQISIAYLSVPILDLLAGQLPQLEKLVLCIDQVVGSNEVHLLSLPPHFHCH